VNHAEAHSHMADYLEGDLDLTKRALLDAHLDGCERCSGEFAEMRGTIGLLRSLPTPEPPPFMVEKVMNRIREGEGRTRLVDRVVEWLRPFATPQAALSATALTVGLLMATGNLDPRLNPFAEDVPAGRHIARLHIKPGGGTLARNTVDPLAPKNQGSRRVARPSYVPVAGRPPAVARAPHITISLPSMGVRTRVPTQVATNTSRVGRSGSGRSITRWPSGSGRSGISVPVGTSLSHNAVANTVAASGRELTLAVADDGSQRDARRAAELDQRLEAMVRRPTLYSVEFLSLSVAEQEIWLRALAERARDQGRADEALRELRAAGDGASQQLATAFAAELRQVEQAERSEMASVAETGSQDD
jgi:hypothetical protein